MEASRWTRSAIRALAQAIGDYNPLYWDEEYARNSVYSTLVVPPGAMYDIEQINAATDGMPGMHALFRGMTLEWYRPVLLDDVLTGKAYLTNVQVKESQLSGQSVIQEYDTYGYNQKGELAGKLFTSWSRHERQAAKARESEARQSARPLAFYTPNDLTQIRHVLDRRAPRRGAEIRFWEDVQIGEKLPNGIKGPTSQAQRMVAEAEGLRREATHDIGGTSDWGTLHAQVWKLFERHPALPFINEQGIPEIPWVIHNSNDRSREYLGLPGGYDAGFQRMHWGIQLFTDWMGDHGLLRKITVKFPQTVIMGDTTWLKAKVVDKRIESGKHVVELEYIHENQLGHIVTAGTAEVVLLSRSNPYLRSWD
jgi:acyl dehydratase